MISNKTFQVIEKDNIHLGNILKYKIKSLAINFWLTFDRWQNQIWKMFFLSKSNKQSLFLHWTQKTSYSVFEKLQVGVIFDRLYRVTSVFHIYIFHMDFEKIKIVVLKFSSGTEQKIPAKLLNWKNNGFFFVFYQKDEKNKFLLNQRNKNGFVMWKYSRYYFFKSTTEYFVNFVIKK